MSNDRSTSPISVPSSENRPRRGSFAGLPFDLFSKQNSNPSVQPTGNNTQANQQRRLSISTLGLSGSPTQASNFGSRAFRRGSLSSSWGSIPNNEDAVAEDGEPSSPGVTPSSPFARRVSFGAQALREARAGSIGNGRYPPPSSSLTGARRTASTAAGHSPPSRSPASASSSAALLEERSNASRRPGEGFNWTEALRHRAERAPSIGGPVSPQNPSRQAGHQRAASIASMEQPIREIPKQPKQNKPDFFQEKILRGDFMD
ncbi:hypothetical protein PEBR_16797 [Penicillium brasilianum]|uniref:Uncharacterized protein n=1 Tax=Penicillium brasilianum TaxID=104259 RepID=A0A0F7TRC9_PENBI|nr:hypothetical protein PEBR_16797 [Penicillium brasilianum]CEJ57552.1 hypothetical protein PMG11_06243 [Penicillium brasilianum]